MSTVRILPPAPQTNKADASINNIRELISVHVRAEYRPELYQNVRAEYRAEHISTCER